ncbi:MAG TPA: peptidoglycan DD-metalloendopeptidase family protein [Jiangellaceae bacterium]|nr:peptidoglycan DD-metalloendopeptidase family protein [Jiangellaceae bacterium]
MDGLRTLAALAGTWLPIVAMSAPGTAGPMPAASEWIWPIGPGQPAIVRGFDPPELPWEPGHRGVDLLGAEGVVVRAAGSGIVTYAGPVAGVGVVTVTHGELRTTYQPVAVAVTAGDRVGAGDPIGTLTASGSHCAPSACLHWGLLRGDRYLDPLSLVGRAGRARLLPLGPAAVPGTAAVPGMAVPDTASGHVHHDPTPTAGRAPASGAEPPRRPASQQASLGVLAGVRL